MKYRTEKFNKTHNIKQTPSKTGGTNLIPRSFKKLERLEKTMKIEQTYHYLLARRLGC